MQQRPTPSISSSSLGLAVLLAATLLAFAPVMVHASAAARAPAIQAGHAQRGQPAFSSSEVAWAAPAEHPTSAFSAVQSSGPLVYGGGPVVHHPTSYLILWGASWTGADSAVAAIIRGYFADLGGTAFENILTQYHDTSGPISAAHTLGGVWVDSSAPPTDTSCGSPTVEDAALQSEINTAIATQAWPRDSGDAVYEVFAPCGVVIKVGTHRCNVPAGGWCAYHGWAGTDGVAYIGVPYPAPACQVPTLPNGNVAGESAVNLGSHELFEAISDPQPTSGWADGAGQEIGDKCAWDFSGGPVHLNNGGTFEVQAEYSNASGSCVTAYGTVAAPPPGVVTNGGFEGGDLTGWTRAGTTGISATAHAGAHAAQLGATTPTNGDSVISQTFTIPSGATTLAFWYQMHCPDAVDYDWATATLKDNTSGTTVTILPKVWGESDTWWQVSAGVTAGHSVTLTLTSHDDGFLGDPTFTRFDDVAVG